MVPPDIGLELTALPICDMKRRLSFVFVLFVMLAACDRVPSKYDTWEDAQASRLVERGWLPGILPPSAREIVVENNLDPNSSSGSFYFDPEEFFAFRSRIVSPDARSVALQYAAGPDLEIFSGGYSVLWHAESDSQWVFICIAEKGVCRYHMV